MFLKIVHASDFHIGASLSQFGTALSKMRGDEIRASLTRVVDFCKEKNADALIIPGDLFDSHKPSKADTEFVRNALSSLSPIPAYIIFGNHDYMCSGSPFSEPSSFSENVHVFPCYEFSFEIPEKNVVFWGKSYSQPTIEPSFESCIFDKNKINIMLLHGDTTESSDTNIISKETLTALPCNYAAFGHIHAGEIFHTGKVKCAYSGAVEGHSFKDSAATGIIYAEISENETHLTPIDFSTRKFRYIDADVTDKTEDEIIAFARPLLNGTDFFRLTLKGEFPENSAPDTVFIKNCLDKDAFYIDIIDETIPCYDLESIEKEESLRGAFLRELRKNAPSEEDFALAAKTGLDALCGRIPDLGGAL